MAANKDGNEEYSIRRSSRHKRSRDEWNETLVMSVRRSRASGDSETIAVSSRGGKPSHRKSSSAHSNSVTSAVPTKFCHECGVQFLENAKFCHGCGSKRESVMCTPESQEVLQETQDESRPPSSPHKSPEEQQVVDLVSPDKPKKKGKNRVGRRYEKTFLRCGWQIIRGRIYIAPDGKQFCNRAAASKYHRAGVPKLEPVRKDGWSVWCNESMSHQDWIAPDGTKLHSYAAAVAYGKGTKQPVFGKDGISHSIHNFFQTPSSKKSKSAVTAAKSKSAGKSQTKSTSTTNAQESNVPEEAENSPQAKKNKPKSKPPKTARPTHRPNGPRLPPTGGSSTTISSST